MSNDHRAAEEEQVLLALLQEASNGLADVAAGRFKEAMVVLRQLRQQRTRATDGQ